MAKVERTRYALVKWISGGDGFDVLSVDTCLKHDQVLKENVLQNPTNYIGQNMEFHFNDGEETDPGLLIAIGSEKDMELKRATLREREFERLGCPRTYDNIKNIEITSILEPVEAKRIRLDYATEEIIEIVNTTEAGPYEPIKKCRCKKYNKLKEKYERIKTELEIKENKIQKYKEKKSFFHKMQDLIDNNGSNITSSKANSQNHDKETNTEEFRSYCVTFQNRRKEIKIREPFTMNNLSQKIKASFKKNFSGVQVHSDKWKTFIDFESDEEESPPDGAELNVLEVAPKGILEVAPSPSLEVSSPATLELEPPSNLELAPSTSREKANNVVVAQDEESYNEMSDAIKLPLGYKVPPLPRQIQELIDEKNPIVLTEERFPNKIIALLYEDLSRYTLYPSHDEYNRVCQALVHQHRFLVDRLKVGTEYGTWLDSLKSKFKRERRHSSHLQNVQDARKKHGHSKNKRKVDKLDELDSNQPPMKLSAKKIKRFQILDCCEDETSIAARVECLQEECRKSKPKTIIINEKMKRTFEARRRDCENKSVPEMLENYPNLIDEREILSEFTRTINNDDFNTEKKVVDYIKPLTKRIFQMTLKSELYKKLKEHLLSKKDFVNDEKYSEMEVSACLILLPLIFKEDPSFLFTFNELISSVNRGSDDTASSLLSMSTEKFQKTVLLMLKDLSSKMDTLAKLSRNGSTAITPVDITPKIGGIFDVAFPIGYDKLKEVEELLQNNEEQKNAISIMRCWGGKDLHSIIRRALKKTFDHQLVLKMNWIGANGNVAFKRLKLKEIICAAVYQNPNLTNASELTDYDIENIMQKWLKYKGDRNGGRTQRAKRALQDGQIQQNLQSHVEDKDEETEIDERVERIHSIERFERGELEKKPKLTENSQRFGCCHLERRLPRGQYSEIAESSLRGTYSLPLARSLRGGHSQPAEPSQRVRQDFILQ